MSIDTIFILLIMLLMILHTNSCITRLIKELDQIEKNQVGSTRLILEYMQEIVKRRNPVKDLPNKDLQQNKKRRV